MPPTRPYASTRASAGPPCPRTAPQRLLGPGLGARMAHEERRTRSCTHGARGAAAVSRPCPHGLLARACHAAGSSRRRRGRVGPQGARRADIKVLLLPTCGSSGEQRGNKTRWTKQGISYSTCNRSLSCADGDGAGTGPDAKELNTASCLFFVAARSIVLLC
jgi:hypothetical protein